ncbi:MAG: restriction endonuclease subunit S, partial [Caulobacterales bacterium]|nr:restriction endonuclease subunit S [Caulobacterales bacterium]
TQIAEYWNGEVRWMNSGELNLKNVYEVDGRITIEGLKNSATKLIPENCILIGLAGQGRTRGTVAINHITLCTNQSIAAIFPNSKYVSKYLYYNLDMRYEELRELSSGDSGRGGLNLKIIGDLVVNWPPIDEQASISQILTDMDSEISTLETKLEKAKKIKQGMMQDLLTGKVRLI